MKIFFNSIHKALEAINIRIKKILVEKDLPVSKLAELIGTSKQNLSRILDNEDLKLNTFIRICEALNINPGFLIAGHQNDDQMSEPEGFYGVKTESELLFELRDQVRNLQIDMNKLKKRIDF